MKIAIHNSENSFSQYWIQYCQMKNIPYKVVNAYDFDIIEQLRECDAFMWHHHQSNYKDALFAKQLLFALEQTGKKVFPDFNTGWHFDDKVGQKYLLEAINAPLVPSYVFYEKEEALQWAQKTTFPKVFKLRGGASAVNVRLVKSSKEASSLIKKAFGKGFSQFNRINNLKERYNRYRQGKDSFFGVLKGLGRLFIPTEFARMHGKEKGYVYFQDFMPDNNFDIRLIVIGQNKAYGLKRMNRKGDFRASGSNSFVYDVIDDEILRIAFTTAKKLKLQSVAFDFIYDENKNPLIVEMSYGYGTTGSGKCTGYWDDSFVWHEEAFNPFQWMVNLIHIQ